MWVFHLMRDKKPKLRYPKFPLFLLFLYQVFNVYFCNSQHFMFSHLNNLLCNFSLTQVVPSFTHVSPNGSKSLIDLALLADVSQLLNCSTIPPLSSSDHLGVSLSVKWGTCQKDTHTKPRHIWIYKNADFAKTHGLIQQTDWDSLLSDNVDLSTSLWTQKFIEIIEECVPQCDLGSRKRNLPWLTKNMSGICGNVTAYFKEQNGQTDSAVIVSTGEFVAR